MLVVGHCHVVIGIEARGRDMVLLVLDPVERSEKVLDQQNSVSHPDRKKERGGGGRKKERRRGVEGGRENED